MSRHDTIAAIATPPGRGGIGIVRVSGAAVTDIASRLLGVPPRPRYAHYTTFDDGHGELIDQGILLYFAKPASFTGEDVLELQVHGGPVVLQCLLRRLLELGCRQARAGEFSERAFLNDKIDLVQAEAIADLIAAESEQSARAAVHSLQGEFSARIHALLDGLTRLRMHVESALDFPEEEIDFLADAAVGEQLAELVRGVAAIERSSRQGKLLSEGLRVVIAGKPNAGKSSLLNALAGFDSAIVSDIPGTTRDVIREHIAIDGVPLHIIDTAGLREAADAIELEGVRRAEAEIEKADMVIRVIDASNDGPVRDRPGEIQVCNKIDLSGDAPRQQGDTVWLSARSGDGLDLLRRCILQRAGYDAGSQQEGLFSSRSRHVTAIAAVRRHLEAAAHALETLRAGEIMAEELRLAQNELAQVTGEFSPDDLLGRIFAEFCIGK